MWINSRVWSLHIFMEKVSCITSDTYSLSVIRTVTPLCYNRVFLISVLLTVFPTNPTANVKLSHWVSRWIPSWRKLSQPLQTDGSVPSLCSHHTLFLSIYAHQFFCSCTCFPICFFQENVNAMKAGPWYIFVCPAPGTDLTFSGHSKNIPGMYLFINIF